MCCSRVYCRVDGSSGDGDVATDAIASLPRIGGLPRSTSDSGCGSAAYGGDLAAADCNVAARTLPVAAADARAKRSSFRIYRTAADKDIFARTALPCANGTTPIAKSRDVAAADGDASTGGTAP